MKIYLEKNVFEASLERMRYLFDEFPEIIVNISGGKDSTVVFNLALQIAREKNRLPLKVFFIDQEAEWQSVIDYVKTIMYRNDVEPLWLQVPIKIFNATSHSDIWLYCWDEKEKDKWIHPKDPISLKENKYGTDRFARMFKNFIDIRFKDKKACFLAGVRTEESPARFNGLTNYATYKYITWGRILNRKMQHFAFYPIYDWSYTDVWKYIFDNDLEYCRMYDYQYQYGIPIRTMRVSNVHHETAIRNLFYTQEVEPEIWDRLVKRIRGINTAGQLKENMSVVPDELPFMFSSWREYRDYLLENLIKDDEIKSKLRESFNCHEGRYIPKVQEQLNKTEISIILLNDYHGTKLSNFHATHGFYTKEYIRKHEYGRKD